MIRDLMEFFVEVMIPVVLISAVFVLPIVLGTVASVNHIQVHGQIAQIESLRSDVQQVNVAESEDVMGQVAEWNQEIYGWRRYNQMFLICLAVPNVWDEVEPIEIPER